MLSFDEVEDICQKKQTTLVIHPLIRKAIRGYEESFYVGLRCFLRGDSDGVFFLPLPISGYERLIFSKRSSAFGFNILRVEPLDVDGLARVRTSFGEGN
jgi:hypothetical protein